MSIALLLVLGACARGGASPAVVAAGRAFLATNAKAPGVHVTASGLEYRVLQSGPSSGPRVRETDEVKVNYEGTLLDGTVFDSTYQKGEPAVLGVSAVIPAWTEVLQLMRPGDVWEIVAPADLAYGDRGSGLIPPSSVLKFKIELIAINPGEDAGFGAR